MKYLKYFELKKGWHALAKTSYSNEEVVLYQNNDFRITYSANNTFSYVSKFCDSYAIDAMADLVREKSKYLSDNKIPFPLLLDNQSMVSKLYNVEILPTAIFLDTNLIVKRVYPGFILSQQTLMFQYINYLLDSSEKNILKKEQKDKKLPACCSSKSLNL